MAATLRVLAALLLAVVGAVAAWVIAAPAPTLAQEPARQQPIFRGGVDVVTVDVIVTDRAGTPITTLTREDFEIIEEGAPQAIDQFEMVELAAVQGRQDRRRRDIRNRDDEALEAGRPDVRIFAFLLADYQVCWERQLAVRETLSRFIRTELRPDDLVAILHPLLPTNSVLFTYDHESAARTVERFEARKGDYTPRNDLEGEQWLVAQSGQNPERVLEEMRSAVVRDALKALAGRLGATREGRKSIVFVSEGFPAAFANDTRQLREITQEANRHNTSLYALDPRGFAPSGFGGGGPGTRPGCPGSGSLAVQDTLRYLADETDGRAIVNSNRFAEGLAQMLRDSSAYYLLGYTPARLHTDGRFHAIDVRVKSRDVVVRARPGYWAFAAADAAAAATPARSLPRPVRQALDRLAAPPGDARLVRTWVGTARGASGTTRVTVVWEPIAQPSATRDQVARVSLLAVDARGAVLYRGPPPEGVPTARRFEFDAEHGPVEIRLTIEDGAGRVLDREVRSVDLSRDNGVGAVMSTPRVYRARTAREVQALAADPDPLPIAGRELARTERLLIRVDVYDGGTPTARLLGRRGEPLRDLAVVPAAPGATHVIDLALNALVPGEYLVEIGLTGADATVAELVAFRVVP